MRTAQLERRVRTAQLELPALAEQLVRTAQLEQWGLRVRMERTAQLERRVRPVQLVQSDLLAQ